MSSAAIQHVQSVEGGLPWVGNALQMGKDPGQFFYEAYRKYGPVFYAQVMGQRFLTLAGPEGASLMGSSEGKECLRSKEFWGGIKEEFKSKYALNVEDGELHKKLRKAFQASFSKTVMRDYYPEFVDVTDSELMRSWATGTEVRVTPAFQRMATTQLGFLCNDFIPYGYEEHIRIAVRNMINVHGVRIWPKFMLHVPSYIEAKKRFHSIGTSLMERYHSRKAQNYPGRRTLIDDMMEMHERDPESLPASDLLQVALAPYVAGLDTVANTVGCMLFEVLARPDLLREIQAEVDAVYAKGTVGEEDFGPTSMPLLYGAMQETLRLHPIAPLAMRAAAKDFNFQGVDIKEGTLMYIGYTVCHWMEEFYPDPYKFDVRRPLEQYKQPAAFSPYGRGPHTCLGKTLAEVQMMVTMSRIFNQLDICLPDGYTRLEKKTFPTPGPTNNFKIIVKGRRF